MYNYFNLGNYSVIHHTFKGALGSMQCPNCNGKDIGKIGPNQYYCWNCFIEMTVLDSVLAIQQVEKDGSLSSLDDLFTEQERKIE